MMMKLLGVGKEHRNIRRDTVIVNVMHHRGNQKIIGHCHW